MLPSKKYVLTELASLQVRSFLNLDVTVNFSDELKIRDVVFDQNHVF